MKKLILFLSIFIISCSAASSQNTPSGTLSLQGDSAIVIRSGDNSVTISTATLNSLISSALNDTLITHPSGYYSNTSIEIDSVTEADIRLEQIKSAERIRRNALETGMITKNTAIVFTAIFAIVFLGLLFMYLHRRAKYRVMERAIENNYPLSGTILGREPRQTVVVQQAQPSFATPPVANAVPDGQPTAPEQALNTDRLINVQAYKTPLTLIAFGLGGMLFFALADAMPMVGLCSILLFIGASKGVIAYLEQRNAAYLQQQFRASQQQQPDSPQQQQPARPESPQQQPPVFTPFK